MRLFNYWKLIDTTEHLNHWIQYGMSIYTKPNLNVETITVQLPTLKAIDLCVDITI